MPPDTIAKPISSAITDVVGIKERTPAQKLFSSQAFWVTVAVLLIMALMSAVYPDAYASSENLYNITRNFSFIGIMALGMTAVILIGGIDLSVGSIMGVVVIATGLIMNAGLHWWIAILGGLFAGFVCGMINGLLITYIGLPSFIVTLGTQYAFRSTAVVLSENKMIYELGPSADSFFKIFGGSWDEDAFPWLPFHLANSVWLLVVMAAIFAWVLYYTGWGRYLFAIGGNESAAQLTGVPVNRVKLQAYLFSAMCAAVAAVMLLGWQGSAINATGQSYELRVIASTVIGGANLMGGEGGSYGAVIGAALIEVIRNGLLMAGVDSNWQGIFVGAFIVLAVLLQQIRGKKRE